MKTFCFLLSLIVISSGETFAQHEHHQIASAQPEKNMETDTGSMKMTSGFSLNLPMNRDGSGTSWQPDESPMMMYMKMYRSTMLMYHGSIFIRYTSQDISHQGDRGGEKFDGPNWFMFMLTHKLSEKDLFSFNGMFSLDPITEKNGYPLLFQSGETYKGAPLVDRQHPHDLFSGLAINYTHSFSKDMDLNGYFGYPGEPALGPNVFMHRISAMNNPDAALGHHWQDASHITFGVGTFGFRYQGVKVEGSIFTGREPDENRYDFDTPQFDSYSYRINANPNRNFSLQFSQGFIKSPEALEADVDIVRTTASVIHTNTLMNEKFIASSLVWGMNHSSEGKNLHSILLESNFKLAPISIYGRYEFVQKDAHELQLHQFEGAPSFNINAFTLGVNRILFTQFKTDASVGVQGTINFPDKNLKSIYGNNPLAAEIYIKIAPSLWAPH